MQEKNFSITLSTLEQRTKTNKDVLEIYYLCLVLGFKGKYQLHSPENLRRVIDELNIELHPEMYKSIDAISPNALPKDGFIQSVKTGIPFWVYPVAAILICIIFYLVMSATISAKADDVVNALSKLLLTEFEN